MLLAESLCCSKAHSLTFKLQAAQGLFQELPMVEHSSDHLLEGCGGEKEREREREKEKKEKNQIVLGNHV